MFDLASNLSEGIRNTTTVFDNPARDRVRMVSGRLARGNVKLTRIPSQPRHIPADGVLVVSFRLILVPSPLILVILAVCAPRSARTVLDEGFGEWRIPP